MNSYSLEEKTCISHKIEHSFGKITPVCTMKHMRNIPLPLLLARLALAFCFLSFGIWEMIAPSWWTSYIPSFLSGINPIMLILTHGIALTVAGLGVLSGYFPRFFTGLSALMLLEISVEILVQEGFSDVFIRDVALFLFTCALFVQAVQAKKNS